MKRVLFVCVHNAGRSQMAEAFFNRRARERGLTMGCGVDAETCPAGAYLSEDWRLPDPHGQPIEVVREIRDAARQRVEALLDELAASPAERS